MHTDCAGVTNLSVGVSVLKSCVERLMPPWTPASWEKAKSVFAVGGSWLLSAGAPGRTLAPVSSAEATSGEVSLSALMPGWRSANSVALCPRKDWMRGQVLVSVSNVGGVSVIVSWRNGRATLAKAPKVESRLTNSCAWVSATGATSAAVAAAALKKRARPVFGEARLRATGSSRVTSGWSSPSASFRSGPRPASASPKPTRLAWIACRVAGSNVFRTWSISTG